MRIAVVGPQNTGKTTFIKDFIQAFPEYVTPSKTYRDVVSQQSLAINQGATVESQKVLIDFYRDQMVKNLEPNIIFDRCLIDGYAYSAYLKELGRFEESFIKEIYDLLYKHIDTIDMIVLIPTALSVGLVDDRLRDTDKTFIDAINRIFINTLLEVSRKTKLKIVTVTGDRGKRMDLMKEVLK